MRKQPSRVKLCTLIILNSEAQTSLRRGNFRLRLFETGQHVGQCWLHCWSLHRYQVSAAGQRAHLPYCGVHVAPHTADQTVNTDNRQQPLNKPEAGTTWKKKRKRYVGDEEITATDTERSCCSLLHTICYTRSLWNRNLFYLPSCFPSVSCAHIMWMCVMT